MKKAIAYVTLTQESTASYFGREREAERTVCRDMHMPYLCFSSNTESDRVTIDDIEIAECNPQSKPIDSLAGYSILLRSWVGVTPFFLNVIEQSDGQNEVPLADLYTTDNWPYCVNHQCLKRKMTMVSAGDLASVVEEYAVEGKVFVKLRHKKRLGHGMVTTVKKALQVLTKGVPYKQNGVKYEHIDSDIWLILSEPLSLKRDGTGTLEYRVWVVNNNVAVITRYGYPDGFTIPDLVKRYADSFITAQSSDFPKHFVLDVGITTDKGPVLIELNSIMEAGDTSPNMYRKILDTFKNS